VIPVAVKSTRAKLARVRSARLPRLRPCLHILASSHKAPYAVYCRLHSSRDGGTEPHSFIDRARLTADDQYATKLTTKRPHEGEHRGQVDCVRVSTNGCVVQFRLDHEESSGRGAARCQIDRDQEIVTFEEAICEMKSPHSHVEELDSGRRLVRRQPPDHFDTESVIPKKDIANAGHEYSPHRSVPWHARAREVNLSQRADGRCTQTFDVYSLELGRGRKDGALDQLRGTRESRRVEEAYSRHTPIDCNELHGTKLSREAFKAALHARFDRKRVKPVKPEEACDQVVFREPLAHLIVERSRRLEMLEQSTKSPRVKIHHGVYQLLNARPLEGARARPKLTEESIDSFAESDLHRLIAWHRGNVVTLFEQSIS
jgi:hypothetical protein